MQARCLTFNNITESQQSVIEHLISDSFFASSGFLNLWNSMGGNPVYWVVENSEQIIGVLPAVEFGNGKLKRLQALPDGCYGSLFLLHEKIDRQKCTATLFDALQSHGYVKVFLFDYYNSITFKGTFDSSICQTNLVDISSSDWIPPDKKLQSEIRKAERENVQIEKFSKDKHFELFIELMQLTEQRHERKPKYTAQFFKTLVELAEIDSRIIWNICIHKDQAVSSHINFVESNQILNWQVYFDKQFSHLKANQLMLFQLAKSARDMGKQYLNLGASPVDALALSDYKNKWGCEIYEYNCYEKKSLLGKLF